MDSKHITTGEVYKALIVYKTIVRNNVELTRSLTE